MNDRRPGQGYALAVEAIRTARGMQQDAATIFLLDLYLQAETKDAFVMALIEAALPMRAATTTRTASGFGVESPVFDVLLGLCRCLARNGALRKDDAVMVVNLATENSIDDKDLHQALDRLEGAIFDHAQWACDVEDRR